jgi:hypothetical protein
MDWWQLGFLLLVIVAYIFKHILAAQQEAAAEREKVQGPPEPAAVAKTDAEVAGERTELDRRIEQAVERRRETETSVRPVVVAAPKPRLPMPAPVVIAPPVPRYQPPPGDDHGPFEVVKPPRSELPRVVRPAPPKPPPAKSPLVMPAPTSPKPAAPRLVVPEVATVAGNPVSPAVRQVLDLLKNRQTLATAFVLREILDRPVSQRRRRR